MPRQNGTNYPPDQEANSAKEIIVFLETICHRTLVGDRMYIPRSEIHQQMIYFCTDTYLNVFLLDQERFYTAHNKRRNA